MSTPNTPSGSLPDPAPQDQPEPGFDPDALRARYRAERDRRIRPEGSGQYQRVDGEFGYYAADPYVEQAVDRAPLDDRVEALVIGGGFGGLLAGARLRQAGVESIRVVEKGGDFGGTWYWNRYPGIHCDIESYIYMPLLEEVGYLPKWKYAPGEEIRQHAQAIGAALRPLPRRLFPDPGDRTALGRSRVGVDRQHRPRRPHPGPLRGDSQRHAQPGRSCPASPASRPSRATPSTPAAGTTPTPAATRTGTCTSSPTSGSAVIGTGATAIQCVPHLGADAQQLYVFQRTPSSVDVRDQPPDRPGVGRVADARLAAASQGQLPRTRHRRPGRTRTWSTDGWTSSARLQQKLHRPPVPTTTSRRRSGTPLRDRRLPEDERDPGQGRRRRRGSRDRRDAQALVPLHVQAAHASATRTCRRSTGPTSPSSTRPTATASSGSRRSPSLSAESSTRSTASSSRPVSRSASQGPCPEGFRCTAGTASR